VKSGAVSLMRRDMAVPLGAWLIAGGPTALGGSPPAV
jgi:hypothetical protein